MENLPVEIIQIEIGKYLDLSGLIAMSLTNKKMMNIFHRPISQIVYQIDPFSQDTSIFDLLNMMRIGTMSNVVFKIYKYMIRQIVHEIFLLHPYHRKERIIMTLTEVVPTDAIQDLKNKIKDYITKSDLFIVFRDVVYRNYLVDETLYNLENAFVNELMDIIEPLLHELSERSNNSLREDISDLSTGTSSGNSYDNSLTDAIDYFPYENVVDSLELMLRNL